ncbi:MAG TPA: FG-GAP-like repeat-containing protein [Candidatus Acidoferrales bacterium]|nr:FG-GAP-like repeat-containing protein [Candidatus Acidoferrales bacterium]
MRIFLTIAFCLCTPLAATAQVQPAKPALAREQTKAHDSKRAKQAYERGLKAEKQKNWPMAFAAYTEAVQQDSTKRDYLLRRELARSELISGFVDRAERDALTGRLGEAREELNAALVLDPGDEILRERLAQLAPSSAAALRQLMAEPAGMVRLEPLIGTRSFDYRGDTMGAYQAVAREFGVDASFDVDLQPAPVHLRIDHLDFSTAARVLGDMTGTFWRPLTRRLFFVAADTPQKRRAYDLSVVRTVELPGSETPSEMTEVLRIIRSIAGITRAQLNESARTITMRASPQAVSVAAKLLEQLQQPRGEMVLEVEILEVDRNAASQIGITPPTSASTFSLTPQQIQTAQSGIAGLVEVIQQLFGPTSALSGLGGNQIASLIGSGQAGIASLIPPLIALGGGRTTFLATLPGAAAAFSNTLSVIKSGKRVLLRAEDAKPVTFFVGDRVPIALAQFSSSLTSPTFIPAVSSDLFPRTDIATGRNPVAIVVSDFNADNKIDLANANHDDNTVSIFLGNGDGTFAANGTLTTGQGPAALVTADFNNDSIPDLAVVNETDGTVSIFLGNGDGTFTLKGTFPTGNTPVAAVATDFDGDGHPDLAVVNQADNTVSILLGNGDGTFQAQTVLSTGLRPSAIVTADFNNDGQADLAITNQSANTASIFLGNGTATFISEATIPTGALPVAIAAGQFNLDTNTNIGLAIVNQTDNTISNFLGNGDGTFTANGTSALNGTSTTGNKPVAITAGDFNVDGRTDLAISDEQADTIDVLIGNGDGTFASPLNLPTGAGPIGLVAGEFLGTTHPPDLAVTNSTANTLSVILDNATFNSTNNAPAPTPYPSSEYEDIGLKMKATPHMHSDHDVTIELHFELRSLTGQTVNSIPVISNQTIDQTVRVKDGETTALAGIIESQEMRTISGTPGLAELGPLGLLGSNRNTQNNNTELLILLTPRIVTWNPKTGEPIYAGRQPVEGGGTAPIRPVP